MTPAKHPIFNRNDLVAEGWYWLIAAKAIKPNKIRTVRVLGHEIVIYRTASGELTALDAYCPHMGAHLREGKVEGEQLRCFFHGWRFNKEGECTDIPCLTVQGLGVKRLAVVADKRIKPKTGTWKLCEKHGLVWIWLGDGSPPEAVPEPSELKDSPYDYSLGTYFVNGCHPNVTMINAIDEQHFKSVHSLPGHILKFSVELISRGHIQFKNIGEMPTGHLIGRLLKPFYRSHLTYNLNYWYGSNGIVTFGPDLFHLYVMFAMRMTERGGTEGYTIVFTKRRQGLKKLFSKSILLLTKIAVRYFGLGDNKIFDTICFSIQTPIDADSTVLKFIQHCDKQKPFLKKGFTEKVESSSQKGFTFQ